MYNLLCHLVIECQGCPRGWKGFGNSCYFFVIPTLQIRQMSWEDSRANCLGYGADMVSILNSSEVDFIYQQTSALGNYGFWIGLFCNKTTNDTNEGWIWSDGSNFTNPQQWLAGEPKTKQNKKNCAELFANSKGWKGYDCAKLFSSICKRKKGNLYKLFLQDAEILKIQYPFTTIKFPNAFRTDRFEIKLYMTVVRSLS